MSRLITASISFEHLLHSTASSPRISYPLSSILSAPICAALVAIEYPIEWSLRDGGVGTWLRVYSSAFRFISPLRYNVVVPCDSPADSLGTTSGIPSSSARLQKMDGLGWIPVLGHGSVFAGKILQYQGAVLEATNSSGSSVLI